MNDEVWKKYKIKGKFEDRVYGGLPANPEIVEQFLAVKGVEAESLEAAQKMIETSQRLNTFEGADKSVTGIFGKDDEGIYLSGYQLQGAIKEALSMLQPITAWRQKAARGMRVLPTRVYLKRGGQTVKVEDGFEQNVVHTEYMGKPMSSLKKTGYIERPDFEFVLYVTNSKKGPLLDEKSLRSVLDHIEVGGIGAMHSMGKGMCKLELVD